MIPAQDVDVVLLCGGQGRRLKTVIADRQKTMADVAGAPFLDILVDWAVKYGFKRFIFCTGYQARSVEEHFKKKHGLDISFSREEKPLGTAGAVKRAQPLFKGRLSLVLNGDSYCPVDLTMLLRFHSRHGGLATMVVVAALRADGGFLRVGPDGKIGSFQEKTPDPAGFLNAGIYLLGLEALAAIPDGASSFEKDIFPAFVKRGIYAYEATEQLWDIGTPERLEAFRRAQAGPHV